MTQIIAIILGGGRGSRLAPLTDYRAKPAVPLAGKYRLVDVPISNCIHNGLFQIYVLTQFESASLNRHISLTYRFDQFHEGRVEVLAAEERHIDQPGWFQGTADAVRQTMHHTLHSGTEHYLILAGDALYRMDYKALIKQHIKTDADLTVACKTVDASQAPGFGIMDIDSSNRIQRFTEKPPADKLTGLEMDEATLKKNNLNDPSKPYLASMGIYVFKRKILKEIMQETSSNDFGKEIIPSLIENSNVFAYPFTGYWEDVGTIQSYYQANLDLTDDLPEFNLYDATKPIYTRQRFLPASKMIQSHVDRAVMAEGCIVLGSHLRRAVLGVRSMVRRGSTLENVVMNGADHYSDHESHRVLRDQPPTVPLGIGENSVVRNAIIDKNARIGNGVRILNEAGRQEADEEEYAIRNGLVIIKKNAVLPDDYVI